MDQFTPEQCQATAVLYQQLSLAVLRRRIFFIGTGIPASDSALVHLQSQQINLGNISDEYALKAANLTLDHAGAAAAKITDSLANAKSAMTTLAELDKAISIASDAINLSVAIYTEDFNQIAAAAKALEEASA